MWTLFEADTANALWTKIIGALRQDQGVHCQPGRGGQTREILHSALTLRNPRERWITVRRPAMNPAFALAEVFWILGGRRDAQFLSYFNHSLARHAGNEPCLHGAYGYRLRHHFQVDQFLRAYETLSTVPTSRQVVLQIWDPEIDLPLADGQPRNPDIPCNTQSIVKVRDGRLEWLQIMRSNDVFLGLPHNLVQFTMLQEVLAGWLGLDLGAYHHVSDSLHVYERDAAAIHTTAANQVPQSDVFALSKEQSLKTLRTVIECIEQVIDERRSSTEIAALITSVELPEAYRNALCVLVAEGLRRRKDVFKADEVMSWCTSPTFRQMWVNWSDRLKSPTEKQF
jgi:thymidylate synthase